MDKTGCSTALNFAQSAQATAYNKNYNNINMNNLLSNPISCSRLSRDELQSALDKALAKIDANIIRFSGKYPDAASSNGKYRLVDNVDWTASFWPGQLWLAYEITGNKRYLDAARSCLASFDRRIRQNIEVDHHDIGFLYTLSTVPAWKLAKDSTARDTSIYAADRLLARYKPAGQFLQAWGDMDNPNEYRLIIDCLMNLSLLYWADRETGDSRYSDIATKHLCTTLKCIIRPDDTTYHTYYFDPVTGAPMRGVTAQGLSDGSCWARGQAWGIYGFALACRNAGMQAALAAHTRLAEYFFRHLPADYVCYWDLVFTAGDQPRDSSAAAIAVCGLLEGLVHLPAGARRERHEAAAHAILRNLIQNYAAAPDEDGLILHGVYSIPHKQGVDECCNWGDYFYLEALVRLLKNWEPYW